MEGERVIDRLRKGEKVLCPLCRKHYLNNNDEGREYQNYFHCEDDKCNGYVHEQKAIYVD